MKATSDAAFGLDAAALLTISAAICVAADQLVFMTVFVPVVLALRFAGWARVHGAYSLLPEGLFFGICLVLGGFNDWNSVVAHGIYEYTVPHFFEWTTIPVWMLVFWGLILRFFVTFATWERLDAGSEPRDLVRLVGSRPALKVALQLVLVVLTRQLIYRFYADPIWSWVPFLIAAGVYFALFPPDRAELHLVAWVIVIGPLVEIVYIGIGGLHRYHLGWIAGVPLWIALWWVVAVLVWKDLGRRIELGLHHFLGASAAET